MKRILCFGLASLLMVCIDADSISIASQRSAEDIPINVTENSKVTGTVEAQSDVITPRSEMKENTLSETGTRSLFSGYRDMSRLGGPFSRPPWFMFPPSSFFNEFDSSSYGSSRYGDEDGYRRRYPGSMRYDERYPEAYGSYGMMGQYGGSFYPGGSQGMRYPAYDQQLPPSSSSYYSGNLLGETNAQPQEYYRGQPAESQRFSAQGMPYDRNRIESNAQPQRPYGRDPSQPVISPARPYYQQDQRRESQPLVNFPSSYDQDERRVSTNVATQGNRDQPAESQRFSAQGTPYDRNRIESNAQPQRPYGHDQPQPVVSPARPYYQQDQRREFQPSVNFPSSYDEDERRASTNVSTQSNRDQRTNSNDATLNASPQSTNLLPTPQRTESTLQPQSVVGPARDRRTETTVPTTTESGVRP